MNSWFWSREEVSTRLHPRDGVKASTRSRHMAKEEPMSRPQTSWKLYVASSSGSEDESIKKSWFWVREKTSIWSRPREETNSRSWFRSKKEVCESSSGSECDDSVKSWFWAGEEGRHKPRARKGANVSARHRAKQETSIDFMSGSMDVVKKEPWFWPGEKANNLAEPKSKKEVRARAVVKEEAKIKARARAKQEARPEEEFLTGAWFSAAEDSSMVGRATIKSGSQVEDDSIVAVGSGLKKKPVVHSDHRLSRILLAVPCLELGKRPVWKLRLMPLPNQCQQMRKKRSLPVFAGLMKKPTQRQKKRPFLDLGFGSVMRPVWKLGLGPTVGPGESLRKKRSLAPGFGLEKKSVQWLSSEKRPGQELKRRQYLGLGFGLETRPTWILGQKSAVILCQGLKRRRSTLLGHGSGLE